MRKRLGLFCLLCSLSVHTFHNGFISLMRYTFHSDKELSAASNVEYFVILCGYCDVDRMSRHYDGVIYSGSQNGSYTNHVSV